MHARVLIAATALLAGPAMAATPASPIVIELFTSEGCSSCPPADAFLRDMALHRPDVLPLAWHITYWDSLGWRDPYALPQATQRQRDYDRDRNGGEVYTPQMMVDGIDDVAGYDRPAVNAAISRATAWQATHPAVPLTVAQHPGQNGGEAVVQVGPGEGAGRLLLIGYDPEHQTPVARGENAGRTLVEANVVRSVSDLGAWTGAALQREALLGAGERHAVLLQGEDGRFIAAAVLPATGP
ncbi:MAG TPA: DUF1223 domain-containing protein [Acidisphaera sp.]|nr:DUF1223 domain-containing protein [Acidisphaera sp.]